jgi:hypothetical protein
MKQITVIFNFPEATINQYDNIMKDLDSIDALSNSGLIYHTCGITSKGLTVVDVWESEEALSKFGETLFPILKKHRMEAVQPEIIPVHNMVSFLIANS